MYRTKDKCHQMEMSIVICAYYIYLDRIEMQPDRKVQTKSYKFYLHQVQHTANANSRLTYSIVSAHLVSQNSNQKTL